MDTSDSALAIIVAALLPNLIAVILQRQWSERAKSIATFVICMVAAAVTSVFSDTIDLRDPGFDWVAWAGGIYVIATNTYARFWKPIGLAPAIETKTSGGGS